LPLRPTILIIATFISVAAADVALAQAPGNPSPEEGATCPPDIKGEPPTVGGGSSAPLSDKLARSKGVICPPAGIDRDMQVTPPGGGQDRPARALIAVLEQHKLLDQPIRLTNIGGRGGGNAWDYLKAQRGNPHVLAINSPTIISNKLLGVSDVEYAQLTPIANLYTEYPIFIVRADSPIADIAVLKQRLKNASRVWISLATAIGNPNHIALARLTRHAGGDVKALTIDVFDSARYAIAHLIDGKADLGVITAVSAVPELTAGTLRTVTLSAPEQLGGVFKGVPTLIESGVDCKVGMWRGLIAAPGIAAGETSFWERTLAAATATAEWRAELAKKYWANTFLSGQGERAFLDEELTITTSALGDLGLLPSKAATA